MHSSKLLSSQARNLSSVGNLMISLIISTLDVLNFSFLVFGNDDEDNYSIMVVVIIIIIVITIIISIIVVVIALQ